MDNINSRLEIAYDEFKIKTQQIVSHELNKCHAKQSKYNNTEYIDELISQVLDINQGVSSDTRRYPDSYSEKRPDYTSYDTTSDTSLDVNMILQPSVGDFVEQPQIESTQPNKSDSRKRDTDQQNQIEPGTVIRPDIPIDRIQNNPVVNSASTLKSCQEECNFYIDNSTPAGGDCDSTGCSNVKCMIGDSMKKTLTAKCKMSTSSYPSEVSPTNNNIDSTKSCSQHTLYDCPSHCIMDNMSRLCIESGTVTKSDIPIDRIPNKPVVNSAPTLKSCQEECNFYIDNSTPAGGNCDSTGCSNIKCMIGDSMKKTLTAKCKM